MDLLEHDNTFGPLLLDGGRIIGSDVFCESADYMYKGHDYIMHSM